MPRGIQKSLGKNQDNPTPWSTGPNQGCDRKGIRHKLDGAAGVVSTGMFSVGLATKLKKRRLSPSNQQNP